MRAPLRALTSSMNPLVSIIWSALVFPTISDISTSTPRRLLMSFIARLIEAETSPGFSCSFSAFFFASSSGSSSFIRISFLTMRSYRSSRCALGRSSPSSTPRLFRKKPSLVILFLTIGLCASVLSMITEKLSTYAVSALLYAPGFCLQYSSANFSMSRSIFCASPGNRNPARNARIASSSANPAKSIDSAYACMTATFRSSRSPR